jgi:hypothetical protein
MQWDTLFNQPIFTLQIRFWQMALGSCEILDASGAKILYAALLGFVGPKIRVYAYKPKRAEILEVKGPRESAPASEISDYPVLDSVNDVRIGTVRLTNDGWLLLNQSHQETACFKNIQLFGDMDKPTIADQGGRLPVAVDGAPAKGWDGYVNDVHVCRIVKWGACSRMSVDCSFDTREMLDRRLTLASALVEMALAVYEIKLATG